MSQIQLFGSDFAPPPGGGCAGQTKAYGAQKPARPRRNLKQTVAASFARKQK